MNIHQFRSSLQLVESPINIDDIFDASSNRIISNKRLDEILLDMESICGGFTDELTPDGGLYGETQLPKGIYYGYIIYNPKSSVYETWCRDLINGDLIIEEDLIDEMKEEYRNRKNKDNPYMFWIGYSQNDNLHLLFYPEGICKIQILESIKKWAKILI